MHTRIILSVIMGFHDDLGDTIKRSGDVHVTVVDAIELSHHVCVRIRKHGLLQVRVLLLGHTQQGLPLFVHLRLLLLHCLGVLQGKVDLVLITLFKGTLECLRVDFLENGLEGIEGLLEDLVPMGFGHVDDDWDEEREGVALVSLEDVEEVVVFEEAHGPIGYLQVQS